MIIAESALLNQETVKLCKEWKSACSRRMEDSSQSVRARNTRKHTEYCVDKSKTKAEVRARGISLTADSCMRRLFNIWNHGWNCSDRSKAGSSGGSEFAQGMFDVNAVSDRPKEALH